MSILNSKPAWTKGDLRRLGEALVLSPEMTPELQAKYDDVVLWYNKLATEVAAILFTTDWQACSSDLFDVTARPKTLDTLVQKLRREHAMTLDEVQDLAGVRIDADITLDVQTALAHEVKEYFGERARVRDLRDNPHSGYRAVHVWLRLPAGRVEVQIRTAAQSIWANAYERLGDSFGRGIRYDEMPEDEAAREMVQSMHRMSASLARGERSQLELADAREQLKTLREEIDALPARARLLVPMRYWSMRAQHQRAAARLDKTAAERNALQAEFLGMVDDLHRMLDEDGS